MSITPEQAEALKEKIQRHSAALTDWACMDGDAESVRVARTALWADIDSLTSAAPPAEGMETHQALLQDAARYRFIRDADRCDPVLGIESLLAYAMESLDEAIDAALAHRSQEAG